MPDAQRGRSGVEVYESIRDGRFLWINLSDDDLHEAIDVAYQRKNARVVGLIAYQIAYGRGRADADRTELRRLHHRLERAEGGLLAIASGHPNPAAVARDILDPSHA